MADDCKLTELYTFRIPHPLKAMIESLSTKDKHDLNDRLRLEAARKIHEVKFDPRVYLGDENNGH